MNEGKIPENVLKRSVLRFVKNKKEECSAGASFTEDCAVLNLCKNTAMIGSSVAVGAGFLESHFALIKACNNLYAGGFTPTHVLLSVTVSESYEESDLKLLMTRLSVVAGNEKVVIAGGHTSVSSSLKDDYLVSVTAFGTKENDNCTGKIINANDAIVVSKWIGLEGTLLLAKKYKDGIEERFRDEFTKSLSNYMEYLSVKEEAAEALNFGVKTMKDVSEHGIFGALYELAERAGRGISVNLKDIPVKQEVIELSNFFDINPYEMKSSGMLLMVTEDGEGLVEALENKGIKAALIGRFADNNDKVVVNGEEKRFLEKIKQDSIYKINKNQQKG